MTLTKTLVPALLLAATLAPSTARADLKIGQPAPDFSLPNASDGKTLVALKPLLAKDKGVLVLFIATTCPVSNAYNERMAALGRDFEPKGVAVIGVNANKSEHCAEISTHAAAHGLAFTIVKDDEAKVANLYGAQHTPEAFLVDAKGTLVYHGRIDDNRDEPAKVKSPDLRNALDALVAGKPIAVAETKAFGCSIKR